MQFHIWPPHAYLYTYIYTHPHEHMHTLHIPYSHSVTLSVVLSAKWEHSPLTPPPQPARHQGLLDLPSCRPLLPSEAFEISFKRTLKCFKT